MLAIDPLRWPGMNQAFIASVLITLLMMLGVVLYGRRRSPDRPGTWAGTIFGATYIFGALFIAFGVVPHQWIDHADKNLGWRKDKILYGPFDILKPQALGGQFPFTLSYQELRDIIVVVIHVVFIALFAWLAVWWQKRGQKAAAAAAIETSTYGRPLVKSS
jgi:hypothetical protein